jgi:hypothetical protein
MSEHVDPCAARDHAAYRLLGGVQAGEGGGKRNEIRMIEVGVLNSRREPDHGETASSSAFVTWVPRPPSAPVIRATFSNMF